MEARCGRSWWLKQDNAAKILVLVVVESSVERESKGRGERK